MLKDVHIEDKQLDRVEAIIVTKKERTEPDMIDNSRRKHIATGSGNKTDEVAKLVTQFTTMNKLSKTMGSASGMAKVKAVKELAASGGIDSMMPGLSGMPNFNMKGSSTTPSIKDRFKKRKK